MTSMPHPIQYAEQVPGWLALWTVDDQEFVSVNSARTHLFEVAAYRAVLEVDGLAWTGAGQQFAVAEEGDHGAPHLATTAPSTSRCIPSTVTACPRHGLHQDHVGRGSVSDGLSEVHRNAIASGVSECSIGGVPFGHIGVPHMASRSFNGRSRSGLGW